MPLSLSLPQLELLAAFGEGASLLERLRDDFVSALQRDKLASADMFRGYLDLLRAVAQLVAPLSAHAAHAAHSEAQPRATAEQAALLSHLGAAVASVVGLSTAPPLAQPLLALTTGTAVRRPPLFCFGSTCCFWLVDFVELAFPSFCWRVRRLCAGVGARALLRGGARRRPLRRQHSPTLRFAVTPTVLSHLFQ